MSSITTNNNKSSSIILSVSHTNQFGNTASELNLDSMGCFSYFSTGQVQKKKKTRLEKKNVISQLGKEIREEVMRVKIIYQSCESIKELQHEHHWHWS